PSRRGRASRDFDEGQQASHQFRLRERKIRQPNGATQTNAGPYRTPGAQLPCRSMAPGGYWKRNLKPPYWACPGVCKWSEAVSQFRRKSLVAYNLQGAVHRSLFERHMM